MALSDYFKDRLNEVAENFKVRQIFSQADTKSCANGIDHRMIFHNESVRTYYNQVYGTVQDYDKSGVFAYKDNEELANFLYTYYYVLKYVANNLDTEGKQFDYTQESIDNIITEFMDVTEQICLFEQKKMNQDIM